MKNYCIKDETGLEHWISRSIAAVVVVMICTTTDVIYSRSITYFANKSCLLIFAIVVGSMDVKLCGKVVVDRHSMKRFSDEAATYLSAADGGIDNTVATNLCVF